MKVIYSLLMLIGLIIFYAVVLPWIVSFISNHAQLFFSIFIVLSFLAAWALIYMAFFNKSN